MGRRKQVVLTNLELAVMRVVWQAQPEALRVREVVELLNARLPRPLAYNTVQTMLNILREKGVVRSRASTGRAYLYSARLSREEVSTSMVSDLVERLFDGRVEPLLVQLVENENLDRNELEQLKQIIETQLDDGGTE